MDEKEKKKKFEKLGELDIQARRTRDENIEAVKRKNQHRKDLAKAEGQQDEKEQNPSPAEKKLRDAVKEQRERLLSKASKPVEDMASPEE